MPDDVRWEWRGWCAGPYALPPGEEAQEVHLHAPRMFPEVRLVLEGERLVCARREEAGPDRLEGWSRLQADELPLPPWRARELAKRLGPPGLVPVRELHDVGDLLRFLSSIRSLGAPRALTVTGRREGSPAQGVFAGALALADASYGLVRVHGDDPEWVRTRVARLERRAELRPGGVAELLAEVAA